MTWVTRLEGKWVPAVIPVAAAMENRRERGAFRADMGERMAAINLIERQNMLLLVN